MFLCDWVNPATEKALSESLCVDCWMHAIMRQAKSLSTSSLSLQLQQLQQSGLSQEIQLPTWVWFPVREASLRSYCVMCSILLCSCLVTNYVWRVGFPVPIFEIYSQLFILQSTHILTQWFPIARWAVCFFGHKKFSREEWMNAKLYLLWYPLMSSGSWSVGGNAA